MFTDCHLIVSSCVDNWSIKLAENGNDRRDKGAFAFTDTRVLPRAEAKE